MTQADSPPTELDGLPDHAVGDLVRTWPEPALLATREGDLVAWSASAAELLGQDAGLAAGAPLSSIVGTDVARMLLSELGAARELHVGEDPAAGRGAVLRARAAPLGSEHLLVSLIDISSEHAQRLHRAQAERLASVGELLSSVAHELNNPLTTVLGYAEILLAEDAPNLPRQELEQIQSEAMRCRRIVENLLDLARQGAGEMGPVDVSTVVDKVVEFRSYSAHVADIELVREVSDEPAIVRGDAHHLVQALLNLVTNAEHAVAQRASGRRVIVRSAVRGDRVALEVEDNGPGVPESVRDAVFRPFHTSKPRGQGTGLGLSLARSTAEAHEGRVHVEDAEGGGARFVLDLPRYSPE